MSTPEGNAVLVDALALSMRRGDSALASVPGLLKQTLLEGAWREFSTPLGTVVRHDRFIDFVTTPPIDGLGVGVDLVRRIVAWDMEALDLLDRALQNPHGGDRRSEDSKGVNHSLEGEQNPRVKRDRSGQHLRRLRQDFPDLHAEVVAGRLTVNEAAIRAGIYPRRVSVNLHDPKAAARTLLGAASPEFISELLRLLADDPQP